MDTTTVELDLVTEYDESGAEVAASMVAHSDITFEVTAEFGPNVWPTVRFTGPRDQLAVMLGEHGFEDPIDTYEV